MLFRAVILLCAAALFAGCDSRPEINVITSAEAPAPPTDAAFAQLPSRKEVLRMLQLAYQYRKPDRIELIGPPSGDVHWLPIASGDWGHPGFWVYHPRTRVIMSAISTSFPEAEQLAEDSVRWRFLDGKWQSDTLMGDGVSKFRGIDDPSDEQVIALLQQPGIQYAFHRFGSVPTDIRLLGPARFARDEEGFALMGIPVEFSAQTEIIDFSSNQLHRSEVTVRALVRCDVRDSKWRVAPEVELVSSKRISSRSVTTEELNKLHWTMDSWWRNH